MRRATASENESVSRWKDEDWLCINTIRTLAMDAVEKAKSGHPGAPMGLAPVAYVVWDRHLRHHPLNPRWPNRDRFVLSNGHASMLLYALLHLTGYDLPLSEIEHFRQWGSRTPGHPEYGLAPGVETTTGPLGQGVASSVGMAIAERWLAARFNRPGHELVGYRIYVLCGDGDLMEGISHEAASLAGHLRLGKLVWIYDNNHISIEGSTALTFTEDVGARFAAYGWKVLHVADANDLERLDSALRSAEEERERPSLVIVDSHIAWGAPHKQDTASAHGEPLGEEEVALTKKAYGWPAEARFLVPEEVLRHMRKAVERGERAEREWAARLARYREAYPDLAAEWERMQSGELPAGWDAELPSFPPDAKGLATRQAAGKALGAIAARVPWLLGGSADLGPSTKTLIAGEEDFAAGSYAGRNLHFGVREHAMGGILNGMALSGLRPYGSTFLVFSDYMRSAIRLSALMELPVVYVFTHDSVGIGEDGPTHQPVEQVMSLRAIPHLVVIRPADANEVVEAWRFAASCTGRPVALVLTRQAVPTFDRTRLAPAAGLRRGAYVLADSGGTPEVILVGTGSEVQLCLAAHEQLVARGRRSRVVSMPSWELFAEQPRAYREEVLPGAVRARVAVEAGVRLGWERYVGIEGRVVGHDGFGASAPARDLFREFGFTVERVVAEAEALLG